MLFVRKDAAKLNARAKQNPTVLDDFFDIWELTVNQRPYSLNKVKLHFT